MQQAVLVVVALPELVMRQKPARVLLLLALQTQNFQANNHALLANIAQEAATPVLTQQHQILIIIALPRILVVLD